MPRHTNDPKPPKQPKPPKKRKERPTDPKPLSSPTHVIQALKKEEDPK